MSPKKFNGYAEKFILWCFIKEMNFEKFIVLKKNYVLGHKTDNAKNQ